MNLVTSPPLRRAAVAIAIAALIIGLCALGIWRQGTSLIGQSSPVVVLTPGTEARIGHLRTQIFGFDRCPSASFLDRSTRDGCIRLDQPWVRIAYKDTYGRPVQETVEVVRESVDGNARTFLRRNDGMRIVAEQTAGDDGQFR
jgi:hypothetical protein